MEIFKFLIDSFKEYASRLKGQVETKIEARLIEKKLLDITEKCASVHNKVEESLSLKDIQACEEDDGVPEILTFQGPFVLGIGMSHVAHR